MSSSKLPWYTLSAFVVFLVVLYVNAIAFFQLDSPLSLPDLSNVNSFRAPRQNVWADLSKQEAHDVKTFLFSRSELNLTHTTRAPSGDNLLVLEALQPNKTDVLRYMNGSSGPPPRWARALVGEFSTGNSSFEIGEVHIVDYMIGPLPIGKDTEVLPLTFCYNSGRNYVRVTELDFDIEAWAAELGANVSDITMTLLGSKINYTDPDTLILTGRQNSQITTTGDESAVYWMQFIRIGENSGAWSLMTQGLYVNVEISREYPSRWKVLRWYYNGRFYATASDLREAIKTPGFRKSLPNLDGNWTTTEDFSEGPPGREKPGPMMVQPGGGRFSIDKHQNYVSWMGFEFFLSTSYATALSLHDIRFNGVSIIYELALQEAMAHYAGDDPAQGGLEFLDTLFGMGWNMFELVPGYDCPAYATFLDTTFQQQQDFVTNRNSICIFEYTSDHALQRHTIGQAVSISRNNYLIIRSVSTMGNYDYTIDYILYLDGTIEVKVRASGFIFGAFWTSNGTKKEDEYGYRIHDAVATSIHDHVINFKADLDVAGTINTLVRVALEPVTRDYPWDDDSTTPRNTMHLVEHEVKTETSLDWPRNSGEMYIVRSELENAWGEKRGYRLSPGTGMGTPNHLTIINSTTLGKSAEWASNDVWVVKQKDTEPRSASPWNYLDPHNPLVDFSNFVNPPEDVVEEDLVIYFNLGSHHIPHSGDIPNTLMHTSASSVMFTPFNFHDRDASVQSRQGVRLQLTPAGPQPNYFGGRNTKGVHLKPTDLEPDLTQYSATEHDVTYMTLNKTLSSLKSFLRLRQ